MCNYACSNSFSIFSIMRDTVGFGSFKHLETTVDEQVIVGNSFLMEVSVGFLSHPIHIAFAITFSASVFVWFPMRRCSFPSISSVRCASIINSLKDLIYLLFGEDGLDTT